MNGDGKLDLVTMSSRDGADVLLGQGDGTFGPIHGYALDGEQWGQSSLALGDLNGDGKLDIVSANNSTATLSVLLGKGDGTFADTVNYPTGGGPRSIALGDLNLDGKPDLVATTDSGGSVCLLLGNGDGTFADTIYYPAASSSLALADLNADGKLEVVATSKDAVFLLDLCQ